MEIVPDSEIGHETTGEEGEKGGQGHLLVGHQLLSLGTHYPAFLHSTRRRNGYEWRADDVHSQCVVRRGNIGGFVYVEDVANLIVFQEILANEVDTTPLGKAILRAYLVSDYGYRLLRERFVVDIVNSASNMVHYSVITKRSAKQRSIRFIVMGREMLNGTNRLYPENRDFIICFVFFFRM